MSAAIGWILPLLVWAGVTVGARGWLRRFDLIRCRAGDWGTAFLAGFTLYTTVLFAGALAGIPIARPLFLGAALLVSVSGLVAGRSAPRRPSPAEPPWTPAETVLALAFAAYAALVIVNALFFPVLALDAHSYDGRARYLLIDRTLDLAIYHWPGHPVTGVSNISYPPLYSLGLATTYAFGGWQSKILTAGMSLSWLLVVYGALRRSLPRRGALAWVLVLGLCPEVLSHASYALLNVPAMALIAAESVALAQLLAERRARWAVLAGVLAAGAAGVRPDALVVHGALWGTTTLFLLASADARPFLRRNLAAWGAVAAAPLLTWGVWTLYLRMGIGMDTVVPAGSGDRIGLARLLRVTPRMLGDLPTYGLVFYAWALTLPFVPFVWRGRPGIRFPQAAALAAGTALVLLFASLDAAYGGGSVDVLRSSFKRSLFYLVPLVGIAAALSPPWSDLVRRLGGERTIPARSETADGNDRPDKGRS